MPARKRAPASAQNLDPTMKCPVDVQPEDSLALGLCGPSELRGLARSRQGLAQAPAAASSTEAPMPAKLSMEAVLRRRLRCLDKEACGRMLWPSVGRRDVVRLILSFVEADRPLADTEVGGIMFQDTGSANVDLFFQSVPQGTPKDNIQLKELLEKAWAESPEICLKQMFLLGSRAGKQDRYSFYDAMMWLWYKDPATVMANLHLIPECNYWKGLLEVLARVCEGPARSLQRDLALHGHYKRCQKVPEERKYLKTDAGLQGEGNYRPGSRLEMAREALKLAWQSIRKRYDNDPVYRSLFERVGQLFAEQLRTDLASMHRGQRVSLCAKWCPLLYHSFDRRTLLCEGIARWLFPASLPEFAGCTERQYAYRARDQLRKRLSELTEYMKLPERLMCQHRWAEIRYQALPAACLTKHVKSFEKHDAVRFREFMDKVEGGKVRVNTGALQPHEILKRASRADAEKGLAQAQWRAMVESMREAGQLKDCIAVCDVSGSMTCEAAPGISCMDVAIALSLLVAELASGPLARQVITFHERPNIVKLPNTSDLAELAEFVRRLDWGGSTNFHRVFELLQQSAEQPKKVLVFSDMQFAHAGGNMPVLRQIQADYRRKGRTMPELVFWNLRGASGAPAVATDTGVVLMSGFSSRMLKLATESGPDPLAALIKALDNPLCARVRVIRDATEASELLAGPSLAAHPFAEETAEAAEVAEKVDVNPAGCAVLAPKQRPEPRVLSIVLAWLPCRVAEAALIGKGGQNIQQLRKALHNHLCKELDAGRFRFWLDVRKCSLAATLQAAPTSFGEEKLQAALDHLKTCIPRSVVYNKVQYDLRIDGGLPEGLPALPRASALLGALPNGRAIGAFIGRRGATIRSFQEELRRMLDEQLEHCSFSFRLDVQKTGALSATVNSYDMSVTKEQLVASLQKLKTHVQDNSLYITACRAQARQPAAKRCRNNCDIRGTLAAKDDRGEAARRGAELAGAKRARANEVARARKQRALFKIRRAVRARATQVRGNSNVKMASLKHRVARTHKLCDESFSDSDL